MAEYTARKLMHCWDEIKLWWSWWGWWYICSVDYTQANTLIPWAAWADIAFITSYSTNSGPWCCVWTLQIKPSDCCCLYSSCTFAKNEDWHICVWWYPNGRVSFFSSVNAWWGDVACVDVLVVWWWGAAYYTSLWWWWWVCYIEKLPLYTQWVMPVTVWRWWKATSNCCSWYSNQTLWWISSFWWVIAYWWNTSWFAKSWKPQNKEYWTAGSFKPTNWCYYLYACWWAWWYDKWCNANLVATCLWPSDCRTTSEWYEAWLITGQWNWWDWFTSDINWTSHVYWWWGWAWAVPWANWFWAWNIWVTGYWMALPSCWWWAWWNWAWCDSYCLPVYWYNNCYTCTVPNCCYIVNDPWDHNCNAKYYWWWGGWWTRSWLTYTSYWIWWDWCQWIVIIRYPTDWSYWLKNDTSWWTITTCTIDWKEWRIHTFTNVECVECFYPIFK